MDDLEFIKKNAGLTESISIDQALQHGDVRVMMQRIQKELISVWSYLNAMGMSEDEYEKFVQAYLAQHVNDIINKQVKG